ncbi:MAG: hypothetical protein IJ572_03255 [Bacilli bacterium]|nr:hypothetical protein [Bacilli bacterium]
MKSKLDEEQIAKTIQKLYFYKKIENLNFEEIRNSFKNINNYYKTNNTISLNNIYSAFVNKLKTRNDNSDTNILIYNKNLEKYQRVSREVAYDVIGNNIKVMNRND